MKRLTTSLGRVCLPTEQRDPTRTPEVSFRYIDIAALDRTSKRITSAPEIRGGDAPSRARKAVRAGDVLVSTVRPNLNAVAVVPLELDGQIASTGFCVLRADPRLVHNRYIFYRCITPEFVSHLVGQMRGANYPAVSDGVVKQVDLPLPTPREQNRIVDILDQADTLRQKRVEADSLADRILPALFYRLFGDPISNDRHWPVTRFDTIAKSRLGKMLDSKRQTGEHKRPYLRNLNVQWARLKLDDLLQMDFDDADRQEFRLKRGDLLVCEGGEVGRAAIWREELPECYFQKAIHRVRPHPDRSTPEYLLHLLWSLAKRNALVDVNSKATIPHLTGVQLAALKIIVPPLPLQKRFTNLVNLVDAIQAQQRQTHDAIENLFATTLHRAFTGGLTAKWRQAHMKELLAEMEHQARLLNLESPERN